jgi:transcriptional antiterminator NusG
MQETNTVEIKKQIEDRTFRRYVLSVNSGQEDLVLENLKERVVRQWLQEDVIELLNPKVNEVSVSKKWEKVIKQKRLYPGYLFFKSRMNDKIWYVIRNTPWVRLIVWADTHPVPLTDDEFNKMMQQVQASEDSLDIKVPFKKGDLVLIKSWDLKGTKWTVISVDSEKWLVTVSVEWLWQLTPTTVWMDTVEIAQ